MIWLGILSSPMSWIRPARPVSLDLDGIHAKLPCHQHGDEGHAQAVLQQGIRVLAADEVQTERPLVFCQTGGGAAHHLRSIGQAFVRFEVEGAKGVAKI